MKKKQEKIFAIEYNVPLKNIYYKVQNNLDLGSRWLSN